MQLLLAPESALTFFEFLLHKLLSQTQSQRHMLTQSRCQNPAPAGPSDPNEWAAICTVKTEVEKIK